MKSRTVIGYGLGFLGVAVVLATLALHGWLEWARPAESHEFLFVPLTAGAVIGWFGFFWVDPQRAVKGGDFLLTAKDRLQRVRLTPIAGTPADRRGSDVPAEDVPLPTVPDLNHLPAPEKGS